jgi:hypothetical protein
MNSDKMVYSKFALGRELRKKLKTTLAKVFLHLILNWNTKNN